MPALIKTFIGRSLRMFDVSLVKAAPCCLRYGQTTDPSTSILWGPFPDRSFASALPSVEIEMIAARAEHLLEDNRKPPLSPCLYVS
jgi:hypothetical protein